MSKVSVTPWTPRNSERQAVSPALSIRCLLWRSVHILKYYRVHSFSFSLGEKRGNKSWWQRARASHPILMISWQTLLSTLLENNLFHLKRETARGQPISMIFLQHFYLWVVLFFFLPTRHFFFPVNLCVRVSVCRRRQLKESVYGDKLQQYNTGGGATSS